MTPGELPRGTISKTYTQESVQARIEAFLLDNVGRVVTRDMIREVAADPKTGAIPENWHQRISELRTDYGYTIRSHASDRRLGRSEYLLVSSEKRPKLNPRVRPTPGAWEAALTRAGGACEWREGGTTCGLKEGEVDPVGGGIVHLTPNHNVPHSMGSRPDPKDPAQWGVLCGRHQVTSKNFFVFSEGGVRINYIGLMQAARVEDKRAVFEFLRAYFEQG